MNYSQKTHDWNGNIFHDEQIGHFLQVCESPNIKDILGDENVISGLFIFLNVNQNKFEEKIKMSVMIF